MRVNGLDVLEAVIDDSHRRAAGQGVVTGRLKLWMFVSILTSRTLVCNHISTCVLTNRVPIIML